MRLIQALIAFGVAAVLGTVIGLIIRHYQNKTERENDEFLELMKEEPEYDEDDPWLNDYSREVIEQ